MMRKLWNDECGAIISAELVLVMTIVGIGMITGLTSLRDGVIEELADVGAAIGTVNQSYTIGAVSAHASATGASTFVDNADYCEGSGTTSSRCLTINGNSTTSTAGGSEPGA